MATVEIIADEIWFRGYRVAILTTDVLPTDIGIFIHDMNNGTLFEGEPDLCGECEKELTDSTRKIPQTDEDVDTIYDGALDDILSAIKPFAKGGIVRYADLSRIAQELKDTPE